jgi:hypothetical protein
MGINPVWALRAGITSTAAAVVRRSNHVNGFDAILVTPYVCIKGNIKVKG